MKKKMNFIICFFIVVTFMIIYAIGNNKNDMKFYDRSNKTTTNYTEVTRSNPTELMKKETNASDNTEASKNIIAEKNTVENNIGKSNIEESNVDVDFFTAKSVAELIDWIKNADESGIGEHFLNYAWTKKEILVVESVNKTYEMVSLIVDPNYEYMIYTFKQNNNYIDITVNLSDSMKEHRAYSRDESLSKVMANYNERLKETYKNFQYKKGEAIVLGIKTNIYYNDGAYYEKIDGEKKLISPGAFFEIKDTEVEMVLYVDLKEEKWDNKYLELFKFKMIKLK